MVRQGRQFSGLTSDNNNLTGFVEQEETSSLDSTGKEPVFIEWTDEKHSMYLKSMEASFVDQLYNSRDLLGWRPQDEHLFGSNPRLCRQEYHCGSATDYAGRPITHSEMNDFIHMQQACGGQELHSYGSETILYIPSTLSLLSSMEIPSYYDSSDYYTYTTTSSNLHCPLPFQSTMHYLYPSSSNTNQYSTTSNHQYHNDHCCIATFSGHTSYISSISVSGKYLYTGSSDGEIRAWKRNPQQQSESATTDNNIVAIGKGAVKSLIIYGSDKLFSAHQDHKIRVWRICTQDPLITKRSDRIATLPTLSDRTIKLFNPNNQIQTRRHKSSTWVHHVDAVSALALSPDETILYSVSWDRTLKIWRVSDFKCLESIQNAHDDAVNAVVVDGDGDVYTGSADKMIKVWRREVKEMNLVTTLVKHRSSVNALAMSDDGCVLYSGSSDKTIIVWRKENGNGRSRLRSIGVLQGHQKAVLCLAVVGDVVCSGSADKTIRIWRGFGSGSSTSLSCLKILEGHQGPVKCVAMTSSNSTATGYGTHHCNSSSTDTSNYMVYSGSLDCNVKVWQVSVPLLY